MVPFHAGPFEAQPLQGLAQRYVGGRALRVLSPNARLRQVSRRFAAAPAAIFVQQEDLPAGLACRAMTGLVMALFDAG
ncbi:hypothetical protein NXC14_PC00588 (plasmid) [Rhizobium sp. NXC14]|nr:hypothetical protein NXC14_PC00588 [Rhizobium sp. NXC14]